MAPVSDVEQEGDGSRNLKREDVLCPICLEIYCEPVTLPCTHTFCKVCFLESVDKATLCCPLCRKRVSVWARQHSKNLVNESLWKKIQSVFPQQRLQEEHEPVFCHRVSEPGALRREYEDQVSKLSEEKRELDEQENRASEELIQRLLAEEEELLREQRQQNQEDERLARLLSEELNSIPNLDRSSIPDPAVVKKKTGIGRFLFPLPRSSAHSSLSNKENILKPSVPPPLDYYGPHTDQLQHQQLHNDQSEPEETFAEPMDQPEIQERTESRTKRKSVSEGEELQGKRSCQSSLLGVAIEEWEVELQMRRKQEEEDLRVALELQRQLDQQQRMTDRRKGSVDAYELRERRSGRTENTTESVAATPVRKRAPSSTVTLSSLPNNSTTNSEPATINSALTEGQLKKQGAKINQTSSQLSPQTPKAKRQMTLTDLFNLHS